MEAPAFAAIGYRDTAALVSGTLSEGDWKERLLRETRERAGVTQSGSRASAWIAGTVLALIYLQILAGGLVAGLDAGFGYNTWPLINGAFVPSGLGEAQPWVLNLFENPLTVQFDHRMLGYSVVLANQAGAILLFAAAHYHLWLTLGATAPAAEAQAASSA